MYMGRPAQLLESSLDRPVAISISSDTIVAEACQNFVIESAW
jgi:hypothetical protein